MEKGLTRMSVVHVGDEVWINASRGLKGLNENGLHVVLTDALEGGGGDGLTNLDGICQGGGIRELKEREGKVAAMVVETGIGAKEEKTNKGSKEERRRRRGTMIREGGSGQGAKGEQ